MEIGAVNELVAREHNVRNVTEGPFVGGWLGWKASFNLGRARGSEKKKVEEEEEKELHPFPDPRQACDSGVKGPPRND